MTKLKELYLKLPRIYRWGIPILLVVMIAGSVILAINGNTKTTTTTASTASMRTATATRGDLVIYATGTGTLISKNESSFGFSAAGKVTNVYVKVGDTVTTGQVLAEMDASSMETSYELARLSLANMTSPAAIATAEQALATDTATLDSAELTLKYYESPMVFSFQEKLAAAEVTLAAAKRAAEENPSEANNNSVTAAEKELSTMQKNLSWAMNDYYPNSYVPEQFTQKETDRSGVEKIIYVEDSKGNLVPYIIEPTQAELASYKAAYDLAKATVEEDQIYLAAIKGGDIPDDATGNNLASLINARVALATAEENLNGSKLIAPFNGTVTALSVQAGDTVGTGSIITIADLSQPYKLTVYLDETDWENVKVGYEADVTFDILPDQVVTGKIVELTPTLVNYMVSCVVELDSSVSANLPTGTAATVDVIGGRATNAVLVPLEAVREIATGTYAVFVVENGEPTLRTVEIGISDLTTVEVISGLEAGEVVTTGIVETNQ